MRRDGRNPYGSAGGYVVSSRRGRRDRGMDYGYDGRDYRGGDYEYDSRRGDRAYNEQDNARNRRDYERGGQSDMARGDYGDMRDMHYGERQGNFRPVEAMGYFTGYYGGGEDMARGGRRDYGYDYNYDMNYDYARRGGRRDYGYDMGYDMRSRYDYGYDYAGDMGESLTKEELEHWCKKMMSELDEREKQMFSKETILQRAKNMGIQFDKFSEMEFYVNVVKNYTDHKKSIGENPEMAVKLARDDFNDEDGEYKGSEWLAVYFDTFVKQD